MGYLLSGKTLGNYIGLGVIGKKLVKLLKGFNLNVLAYDKKEDIHFAKENNVEYCTLEKLLCDSDVISVHLNCSNETLGFFDKNKIEKMKKSCIFINT